jgi:hypothetical protein
VVQSLAGVWERGACTERAHRLVRRACGWRLETTYRPTQPAVRAWQGARRQGTLSKGRRAVVVVVV